jgi:hypothetical protein
MLSRPSGFQIYRQFLLSQVLILASFRDLMLAVDNSDKHATISALIAISALLFHKFSKSNAFIPILSKSGQFIIYNSSLKKEIVHLTSKSLRHI